MILNESTDKATLVMRFTELERMFHLLGDQLKETERFQQRLHTLYEVGKIINLILEEDELLQTIIDLALKVMEADCGFIMLYDDEVNLVPRIARKMEADEFSSATSTFSTTIANQVASSGKSILTSDAQSDERFQTGASIISHHIRSVICAPLRNKDQKTIGVLYVGSNVLTNIFSSNDVELLEAFANHAAISIENAKLYEERRRREHLKSALERYVSKQIAERIISNDATGDIRFVPEKREVTVVFSDIRGFTTLAERLSPEDMVEILNRYFTKMIDVIFRYGGTLDKFMGDSIMALFGAPESTGQDAIHAVQAAVEMQNTARQFNEEQAALGKPQITVGIGINTGPVVVGNIGSDQRMEYSAIGDDVNLASRLQGIARGWQILISKATYDIVKKHVNTNRLEPITVKGKTKPVEIYEIVYESPVS
jgi:adenylate cyclase